MRPPVWALAPLLAAPLAGCGTLFNHHSTTEIPLAGAPADLEVLVDGQPAKLGHVRDTELAVSQGIEVPKKGKHEVTFRGGGREAKWTYRSSIDAKWLLLDIFATGLVGVVVDAATGGWTDTHGEPIKVDELLEDGRLVAPPAAATAGAAKDPACEQLVAHVVELVGKGDDRGAQLGRLFATHCDQDAWPADVKACVGGAKDGEAVGTCAMALPAMQRVALFHDGDAVMGW